jgi:phage gp36-like protein
MARFIAEGDYAMQIKNEIIKLLTAPADWFNSTKLVRAEQTAIDQIRNYISKRYDCTVIFTPTSDEQPDTRDQFMVTITIDIALYHLYSQTGMKDIPEHRSQRYQDALEWLKDVGTGSIAANLPEMEYEGGETYGDFLVNSRKPEENKW